MKTVFTTGEAARICGVSQQTIIRCFDNGQLKGFRVPGSRFRRIPREMLHRFMKENGIPTTVLDKNIQRILVVDDDAELAESMVNALEADGRFDVRIAVTGFDAGILVKDFHPDLIVLNVMLPDIGGLEICRRVRADDKLENVRILCTSSMIDNDKIHELKLAGVDEWLLKPFESMKLIEQITGLLEMEPNRSCDSTISPLSVYLDPGDSPQELITEFYLALSALYRAHNGSGLRIIQDEHRAVINEESHR